jgi:hypothetical protein
MLEAVGRPPARPDEECTMRSTLTTVALVGALGLTGVVGGALVAPALSYAATGDATAIDDRVASLKSALEGLVSDGTLSQSQADEVATTLAEQGPLGHRGHGGGPGGLGGPGGGREVAAAAAEALGLTADELRTAAQDGLTLTGLAEREGVAPAAVVDAMVAAAKAHLAEEVTEGDLTQAEADARAAELEARITASVDEPLRLGRGPGGHGRHGHHGADGGAEDQAATPTPSASAGA